MVFIETPTFTRAVTTLLLDDDYAKLQAQLLENPELGPLIKGGGGIRKLRFATAGRGKSGGVRVIYFWKKENEQIYFLLIYSKSKQDNVTDEEAAILRSYVKEL